MPDPVTEGTPSRRAADNDLARLVTDVAIIREASTFTKEETKRQGDLLDRLQRDIMNQHGDMTLTPVGREVIRHMEANKNDHDGMNGRLDVLEDFRIEVRTAIRIAWALGGLALSSGVVAILLAIIRS